MSTEAAVSPLPSRRPSLGLPTWPLRLGRLLCEGMLAYADAACVGYTLTFGLEHQQEPTLRDRDY